MPLRIERLKLKLRDAGTGIQMEPAADLRARRFQDQEVSADGFDIQVDQGRHGRCPYQSFPYEERAAAGA